MKVHQLLERQKSDRKNPRLQLLRVEAGEICISQQYHEMTAITELPGKKDSHYKP
jgi:hypothetical protein